MSNERANLKTKCTGISRSIISGVVTTPTTGKILARGLMGGGARDAGRETISNC